LLQNISPALTYAWRLRVLRFAEKCLHCVPLICTLGARREMQTLVELEAIRRLKPVVVRCNFLDHK